MNRGQLYIAQVSKFFDYCTDPLLCRAVLSRHATACGRNFHFLNAWDNACRS